MAKKCTPKTTINAIYKVRKNEQPILLEDQDEIQAEFREYYKTLYEYRETNCSPEYIYKYVSRDKIRVIPEDIKEKAEKQITETEVANYL